jgi:hypothetical protein
MTKGPFKLSWQALASSGEFELDYSFDNDEFRTVNRLFSSFNEALKTGCDIADLIENKNSITLRVRRLDPAATQTTA